MRPVGVADTMGYSTRRMDEQAPSAFAVSWTPTKRHALVRETVTDTKRVIDLRLHDLAAFVQRAELFAKAVDGLTRSQREGRNPLLARPRATNHRQSRPPPQILVGDRGEYRLTIEQQAQP